MKSLNPSSNLLDLWVQDMRQRLEPGYGEAGMGENIPERDWALPGMEGCDACPFSLGR